jgi:hypothetical protein
MSKILLKVSSELDFQTYNGDYDGVYFSNPKEYISSHDNGETFIDLCALSPSDGLEVSRQAPKNSTFVVDDVMKAIFIKSINPTAKISYYLDGYNENLIPIIKANGFDVTVKYTALAPERIDKFHDVGAKVNGKELSRLDEVGVLKYWQVDYITIIPQIKP